MSFQTTTNEFLKCDFVINSEDTDLTKFRRKRIQALRKCKENQSHKNDKQAQNAEIQAAEEEDHDGGEESWQKFPKTTRTEKKWRQIRKKLARQTFDFSWNGKAQLNKQKKQSADKKSAEFFIVFHSRAGTPTGTVRANLKILERRFSLLLSFRFAFSMLQSYSLVPWNSTDRSVFSSLLRKDLRFLLPFSFSRCSGFFMLIQANVSSIFLHRDSLLASFWKQTDKEERKTRRFSFLLFCSFLALALLVLFRNLQAQTWVLISDATDVGIKFEILLMSLHALTFFARKMLVIGSQWTMNVCGSLFTPALWLSLSFCCISSFPLQALVAPSHWIGLVHFFLFAVVGFSLWFVCCVLTVKATFVKSLWMLHWTRLWWCLFGD